jgi:predicted AlkP superfamily phosphohydrolase/phosphomutase
MRRILPRGTTEALRTRVGSLPHPLESPLTKAVALDGDRCSWIRLNLAGREPFGSVDPADAEAILEDIRAESLLLEQPGSGQRIVTTVRSASEAFGEGHHPDVPDLIVSFREDLGALDACQSARVGLVRAPVEPTMRRTGAHPAVPSHLWVAGAGAERNHAPGEGRAVDVAPTLLSLLGVPAPDWVDGRALV